LLAHPFGVLVIAAAIAQADEPTVPCAGLEAGSVHTVTRILDGETVALDDGTELRLIGALAPRAIDADAEGGAWPAQAAATEAVRALALGKSIELRVAGERTDRYGRQQAHAFLVEGAARRWVQGELVARGFARAYVLAGTRACGSELLAAERTAREAGAGLWADAAYRVRSADQPAELMRLRATFQVVEGRIVRVAQVRETIYLNFDHDWRRGFSVSLRRDDSTVLGTYASNPKGLEGRDVRMHGWVQAREGAPTIDLSAGGLIEILNDADGQPAGQAR
jgi:endonuclease YncB( thermonuclease family)